MELFNQLNVLPSYLTVFNNAGLNLNEIPKELEKCTPAFQYFWDKECREHPTNQNCLIFFDWVINFKFLLNKIDLKIGFIRISYQIIFQNYAVRCNLMTNFFLFKFQDSRVGVFAL